MEYLSGTGPFADRALYPVPRLVRLNLKLPELSGFEVLEWLRKRPEYAALPVTVFSSSAPTRTIPSKPRPWELMISGKSQQAACATPKWSSRCGKGGFRRPRPK